MFATLVVAAHALAMPTLSRPPFVLQLADRPSFDAHPARAHLHHTLARGLLEQVDARSCMTPSNHVLLAIPLDGNTAGSATPVQILKESNLFGRDIELVDGIRLFSTDTSAFQCFLTCIEDSMAIAARIEHTSIWLLVSSYVAVECNPCASSISRAEFADIQHGFVRLLTNEDA